MIKEANFKILDSVEEVGQNPFSHSFKKRVRIEYAFDHI